MELPLSYLVGKPLRRCPAHFHTRRKTTAPTATAPTAAKKMPTPFGPLAPVIQATTNATPENTTAVTTAATMYRPGLLWGRNLVGSGSIGFPS